MSTREIVDHSRSFLGGFSCAPFDFLRVDESSTVRTKILSKSDLQAIYAMWIRAAAHVFSSLGGSRRDLNPRPSDLGRGVGPDFSVLAHALLRLPFTVFL